MLCSKFTQIERRILCICLGCVQGINIHDILSVKYHFSFWDIAFAQIYHLFLYLYQTNLIFILDTKQHDKKKKPIMSTTSYSFVLSHIYHFQLLGNGDYGKNSNHLRKLVLCEKIENIINIYK